MPQSECHGVYAVMTTQHPSFSSAAPWLWSLLTFVVLIVSFFAPGAVTPPLLGLGFGAVAVSFIVASNVPGLWDGIEPESWPLAIGIGLSAVHVIGAVAVAARRATAR